MTRLRNMSGERNYITHFSTTESANLTVKDNYQNLDLNSLNLSRLVIYCQSNKTMANLLWRLDGISESLLLLPPNLSEHDTITLLEQYSPTLIITDTKRITNICHLSTIVDAQDVIRSNIALCADNNKDTIWILCTSGTTSRPKLVRHTLSSLTCTTKLRKKSVDLPNWGLLYDLNRFAGIQVFLQAIADGGKLTFPNDDATLEQIINYFEAEGVNCLSATPSMWRILLSISSTKKLALKNVTLGGEIVDQRILNALATLYPHARIRHIYASTEAGVGFSINDGQEGFPISFLKDPPSGLHMRINEDNVIELKREGSDSDYFDSTGATCRTVDGYVVTGDVVEIKGNRVIFAGRLNGCINVGGNKVYPEQVERVLNEFPGISQSLVYGKKSAIVGYLVVAKISYENNDEKKESYISWDKLRASIIQHCRNFLPSYAIPAIIQRAEHIDINSVGKLDRRQRK